MARCWESGKKIGVIFGKQSCPSKFLSTIVILALVQYSCTRSIETLSLNEAAITISVDEFLRHLEILSDDKLMGRDTGSPGFDSASLYIEENIRALGLRPGGIQNGPAQTVNPVPLANR